MNARKSLTIFISRDRRTRSAKNSAQSLSNITVFNSYSTSSTLGDKRRRMFRYERNSGKINIRKYRCTQKMSAKMNGTELMYFATCLLGLKSPEFRRNLKIRKICNDLLGGRLTDPSNTARISVLSLSVLTTGTK